MICFRCGAEAGNRDYCPSCNADIHIFQKIRRLSNSYYNEGLNQANVRNLSGAIISLQRSLKLNKYNIEARNLLGLIYYEMGDVVNALSEWVISANYQAEDNDATRYLRAIHENRSHLDAINQTIKKYNQALLYCKQDSRDLAIIQLKKVLSLNPKLVKGHQLLALLYLQEGQLDKAKKSLRNAGKIDTDNTTTLRYLKEVNRRLKEKGRDKKPTNDDLITFQSGNETIIMPKRFRESSIGSTLIYIIIGLIVGVAVSCWLIVPGVKSRAKEDAKEKLLEASDTISTNGQTIDDLEKQIEEFQNKLDEADNNQKAVKTQISSYEDLLGAYKSYISGDVIETGNALDEVDVSLLSKKAKKTYKSLNDKIFDEYVEALYNEGYSYYRRNNYDEAIKILKKVIKKDEDYKDGSAAYYLAQAYRQSGNESKAKKYYKYVIEKHPNTTMARTAENYVDSQ